MFTQHFGFYLINLILNKDFFYFYAELEINWNMISFTEFELCESTK